MAPKVCKLLIEGGWIGNACNSLPPVQSAPPSSEPRPIIDIFVIGQLLIFFVIGQLLIFFVIGQLLKEVK